MQHWFQPAAVTLNGIMFENGEPAADFTTAADLAVATFNPAEQILLRDYFATIATNDLQELAEHPEDCESELIGEFMDLVTNT